MLRKGVFLFAILGLVLASAKTYTVSLYDPAYVGATELKPGQYQVSYSGANAVIRGAKVDSQSAVRVETGDRKYDSTSVIYSVSGGKKQIQEIHLGGTKTKIVFTETMP